MKIKNLTPKTVELTTYELTGGREFKIYLAGHGNTDLVNLYIPDLESLRGVIEVEGYHPVKETPTVVETTPIEETMQAIEEIVEEETQTPEPQKEAHETEKSEFICDICGAEFASIRGLTSHKNRVHSD